MARQTRSQYVYFRHEGAETKDVFFRINPVAIRFQQGNKGSVVDTLGGYFREVFYSQDRQYNGLLLPDLVIEGETGVAYRQELKTIDWIWRHHGTPKPDGSPADTYFFDLIQVGPFQDVARDEIKAYLIEISHFAWDETVNDPYRIRFVFRCKILRDFNWDGSCGPAAVQGESPPSNSLPRNADRLTELLNSVQTLRRQAESAGGLSITVDLEPLRQQLERAQPLLQSGLGGSLVSLQQALGSGSLSTLQTALQRADQDLRVAQHRLERLLGLSI